MTAPRILTDAEVDYIKANYGIHIEHGAGYRVITHIQPD